MIPSWQEHDASAVFLQLPGWNEMQRGDSKLVRWRFYIAQTPLSQLGLDSRINRISRGIKHKNEQEE